VQLPQWVPLSVVKGGTAANMLVKGLGSDFMRETTVKTLVQVGGLPRPAGPTVAHIFPRCSSCGWQAGPAGVDIDGSAAARCSA
jgi:hypothetical protein